MTTSTSSATYASVTNGDLSFTNIAANEIDVVNAGSAVGSFIANAPSPHAYMQGAETGMDWSAFGMETYSSGTGASQTVVITYDVQSTDASEFITSIDSLYAVDLVSGDGQMTAVETIRDTSGNLLGTQTFTSTAPPPPPTVLTMGVQNAVVTLTLTETALTPNSAVDASIVAQLFGQSTNLAALGDYVWFDSNNNGLQDSTETGVAGVTVDLLNAAGTSILAVTTTNASGLYHFTNLLPGVYDVKFVAPLGENFTLTSQGSNTAIDSNADQTTGLTAQITLTAGQTDNTIDAGLTLPHQLPLAALGDYVWFDTNGNGLQDSTETGVAGVTVDLLDATGTTVLGVTTTNASGIYGFTNLAQGTYEVQFFAPTGDNFTTTSVGSNTAIDSNANQTTGLTAPITLSSGQTDLTIDAGLVAKPAALGDYVWFDTNSNGLQDSTETGVAGVTVDLLNAAGTSVLGVTTTNASGIYGFTNLAAGTYEVQFFAPAADNFTTTSTGTNQAIDSNANTATGLTAPITLTAGQTDLTIDAGLVAKPPIPAALGDYVWFDTNSNGLQDSTETGVAGVTVDLLNAAGTSVLGVTTTNASGIYGFTNLAAGTYEVQFFAPAADNFTTTSTGTNQAIDSNANTATGLTAPITLTAGQTDLTIDAGLVAKPPIPAALGDYVWFDTNSNGLQDSTETGVAGVTVDLLNAAGTSVLGVTTTNASGIYGFTNLAAGTYEVQFFAPAADNFTTTSTGTNRAIDSNANTTTGLTAPITLTAGQTDLTIDAGLVAKPPIPAALGDYVWFDTNSNGLQDSTETGVAGVTVDLLNAAGTSVLGVSTTNASGIYGFTNLAAGTYEVQFFAPAADNFTTTSTGTNRAIDSNANTTTGLTAPITLTAGQTDLTIDAGLVAKPPIPAALGDYVWFDTNSNGLQDSTETGVAGVTVDLLNAAGTSVLGVTTTNASGIYGFTNLAAGTYEVQFFAPTGDTFTTTSTGTNRAIDSNANTTTGLTAPITLTAGQTDLTIDAGLIAKVVTPTAALGDYVWLDCNNNGLQDSGETGVAGVTVDLLNAAGTSILAVTTTNAAGAYHFTGLAAGTYEVDFISPSGDHFTTTSAGTNRAIDSNANTTTGLTAPVTLTAGQTDNTIDAGLVQTSSISINKVPGSMVVNACGQETYTFNVTDTGSTPITNIVVKDNIGTAANPDYITPTPVMTGNYNVGDGNHNGVLDPGETWQYSITTTPIQDTAACNGTISHTCSGSNLGSGNTAWFSCSFTPTNTKDGTCYVFKDVGCNVKGSGTGSGGYNVDCPDAVVKFSASCTQATTTYDPNSNCWTTTLPANCNPGSVFLSGCPVTVPSGCSFSNANCTWTIGDSGNNCGSSSVSWNASCQGYSSFNNNGANGCSDYNNIGVKVCDNSTGYGSGGCLNSGYGYCGGSYYSSGGGWGGWGYNSSGYQGGSNDCAGTPENQYTNNSCGSSGGGYGYGGGCNTSGCGTQSSGSCSQSQIGAVGIADTVTVTGSAETMCCATVSHTCTGSNLGSGNTGWFSCTFTPTSTKDGTCYTFKGVSCNLTGSGVGSGGYTVNCPDSVVTFSSSCTKATTTYNPNTNCWTTTLPANCNPGDVFLTGCPVTVPSGCSFTNANGNWTIGTSTNNCGSSGVSWSASCAGYGSFDQNGNNGCSDYNNIGVKVCDNTSDYGSGGSLNSGYGWCGGSYTNSGGGYSGWGGGNWWGNSCSYQGSTNDCAGTPENQYTSGNCGTSTNTGCGSSSTGTCTQTQMCTTTVTASDTAEVIVLGTNSSVTENGTTPTGSLTTLYGKAQTLEFTYTPSTTVSTKTIGIGSESGAAPGTMAFIAISNNTNPNASGAQIYFEGTVSSGQKLYADASINSLTNTANTGTAAFMSTTAGASIYADIYASQAAFLAGAAPLQVDAYNTSGSQAMYFNDQVGSLKVVGYVGATGGHLVS